MPQHFFLTAPYYNSVFEKTADDTTPNLKGMCGLLLGVSVHVVHTGHRSLANLL